MTEIERADQAPQQPQPRAAVALRGPQTDFDGAYRLAQNLAVSSLIPSDLRGKPADVLVTVLYGQELGLAPMQAIQSIYVVKGRPSMSGRLWLAKVRQAGHRVKVTDHTDTSCTVTIIRGDGSGDEHTETYTLNDAVTAGLCTIKDGKPFARSKQGEPQPWEKHTKRMLLWRAVSNCATVVCPEVALGFEMTEAMPEVDSGAPTLAEVATQRETSQLQQPEPPADAEIVDDEPATETLAAEYAEIEAEHVDGIPVEDGLTFPPEDEGGAS